MKTNLFLILLLLSMVSCKETCRCDIDPAILSHNDSLISSIDSLNWWETYEIMNLNSAKYDSYRLIARTSYDFEKRVFSLINDQNSSYITVKYLNEKEDGKYVDSLDRVERHDLTKHQVKSFEKCLNENCFWTMKTDGEKTLDGVSWHLEGYNVKMNACSNRNYHMVLISIPDSSFITICNEFLTLANSSYSEQQAINRERWK